MFLPLGVRTISGVMLQIDKSLEECAQMCGAGWGYRIRTVTVPLLWPGLIAAWLLLFVASIRELGASILLMGPHSKVITPSIVESWFASSTELTAAMALIQTLVVAVAVGVSAGGDAARHHADHGLDSWPTPHAQAAYRGRESRNPLRRRAGGARRELLRAAGRAADAARPLGLRQDHDACAPSPGLEQPSAGEIRIGGAPVYSSAQRVNIPAEKRGLSMVFQSYAIWPHMTVFENVAYGLRVRRESKRGRSPRRSSARSTWCRCAPSRERGASQLSGGQQQRVALARAFVFQPSVLLFDEPLSNLDAKLRADMRIELRELQHRLGITSVYVTHDLEEALAMSDRIVVMRDGLIEQIGTPGEIYNLPRNAFVADFVGSANLIRGRNRTDLAMGDLVALETPAGHIVYGMAHGRPAGAELTFSMRTVHLKLSAQKPDADAQRLAGAGRALGVPGRLHADHVAWGDQRVVIRGAAMEPLAEGSEAFMTVEPKRVVLLEEYARAPPPARARPSRRRRAWRRSRSP